MKNCFNTLSVLLSTLLFLISCQSEESVKSQKTAIAAIKVYLSFEIDDGPLMANASRVIRIFAKDSSENIISSFSETVDIISLNQSDFSYSVVLRNGVGETEISYSHQTDLIITLGSKNSNHVIDQTETITVYPALSFKFPSVTLTHSNPNSKYTFIAEGGFGDVELAKISGPGIFNSTTGEYTAGSVVGDAVIRATDSLGNTAEAVASNVYNLTNDTVSQKVLDSSGNLYIGGDFTQIHPQKLNNATAIDSTTGNVELGFDTKGGFNSYVKASVALPDGSVIVGGWFTSYNGVARGRIAKLSATGVLDPNFASGVGFDSYVESIILSPDGNSIYVGGAFLSFNGVTRHRVAKLSAATGELDLTFDSSSGFNSYVFALVVSSDGDSLYVGGQFSTYDGVTRQCVAKLNAATGALDLTFDASVGFDSDAEYAYEIVYSLSLSKNEQSLFAGGQFTKYNGIPSLHIAKLDASTAVLDTTFDTSTGFNGYVYKLLLSPDGNYLYVGGTFSSYKGTMRGKLAKISTIDASLDVTFAPSGLIFLNSIIYSEDQGSILVGMSNSYGVKKVDAQTGLTNASFAQGPALYSSSILTMALLPNNLIFTGGSFNNLNNGISRAHLAKLNPDGSLNSDFDTISGLSYPPSTMKLSPDENHLYVATSGTYKGTTYSKLIKIHTNNASLDYDFDASGLNVPPSAIEISSDGNDIYVASFALTNYLGTSREKFAKLSTIDATLDATFNPPTGFVCESGGVDCYSPAINSILLSHDETALFVGGYFSEYDGVARQNLLKISSSDASLDLTFDPGATISSYSSVTAIANSIDGSKLYVGDENSPANIYRFNSTTGTVDPSFYVGSGFSGLSSDIYQIVPHPDGNSIYVRGSFDHYKGIPTGSIIKLRTINGGYMSQFVPEVYGSVIGISSDGLTFFSGQSQLDPITGASQ